MADIIEQIEAHVMAQFFYSRSKAAGIVAVTNKPELLIGQFSPETKLFVVCNPWRLSRCRDSLGSALPNTDFITPRALNKTFLKDKLLICIDSIDSPGIASRVRKRWVRKIASHPLISIIVMRSSSAAGTVKLQSWLPEGQTWLIGRAKQSPSSIIKDQVVALGGTLLNVSRQSVPRLPILAIIHVYNEQDIIASTISHLLDQGVDVHVIDNWSTDNTQKIIQSLAAASTRVTYEIFPEKANNKFELEKMLTRVTDVAKEKKQYGWVMLNDADEIRWSPWQGVSLQQAFSFVDAMGYSAVDYTVFNFVPTKEGFGEKHDPLTFFEYGEFSGIEGHFVQVKTWKNNLEASLAPSGGHHVAFSNQKIFPLKFFLGHYPIRSSKHGQEKIFQQRKSRFSPKERQKGWHTQYDDVNKDTSFIGNKKNLIKFNAESFWEEFILERLCGIGVKRD